MEVAAAYLEGLGDAVGAGQVERAAALGAKGVDGGLEGAGAVGVAGGVGRGERGCGLRGGGIGAGADGEDDDCEDDEGADASIAGAGAFFWFGRRGFWWRGRWGGGYGLDAGDLGRGGAPGRFRAGVAGDEAELAVLGHAHRQGAAPGEVQPVVLHAVGEDHAALVHARGDQQAVAAVEAAGGDGGAGGGAGPGLADQEQAGGLVGRHHDVEAGGAFDRQGPAGGAGAGGDDEAGGGVQLLAVAEGDAVAGGLVAGMADEHLVQRQQLLAVIELGADHGAALDLDAAGGGGGEQASDVGGGVGHEHAGVAGGVGVDPDDGLAVQVFGEVGDQPVLADGDHHVLGGEEEAVELGAFHGGDAPALGHTGADLGEDVGDMVALGVEPFQRLAAAAEEGAGLTGGGVADQQRVVFGLAGDQNQAGAEGCGHMPARGSPPPGDGAWRNIAPSEAVRSGVTFSVSMRVSFSAKARRVSTWSTAGFTSRSRARRSPSPAVRAASVTRMRRASASAAISAAAALPSALRLAFSSSWAISAAWRRASSMRVASSFSAMVRSFSTAAARRAKEASSAPAWARSKVGASRARARSALGLMPAMRTLTRAMPMSRRRASAARPALMLSPMGAAPSESSMPTSRCSM